MDSRAVMKELHLKEVWKIKLLCCGNVSMENLVKSVMLSMEKMPVESELNSRGGCEGDGDRR